MRAWAFDTEPLGNPTSAVLVDVPPSQPTPYPSSIAEPAPPIRDAVFDAGPDDAEANPEATVIYPGSTGEPLLPGEARRSDLLEDAEHWAAVYEELTGFLLTHGGRRDTTGRFCSRLEYWRHRRDELAL